MSYICPTLAIVSYEEGHVWANDIVTVSDTIILMIV